MLKFQYENVEDIPEGLEEFYKEGENGTFVLKVEGAVDKTRLDEFRTNNTTLMDELDQAKASLEEAQSTFKDFKTSTATKYGDVDLEAYNEMKANQRALKEQTLIDGGKHKELLAMREDELRSEFSENYQKAQKALEDAERKHAKQEAALSRQLSTLLIDNKLTALAAQYGVRSTAIQDVLARGKGTWSLEDGDVVAHDGNGNKMYGTDGTSLLDMNTWMESLSTNAPHLFEASNGSGEDFNIDELLGEDNDPGKPEYHKEKGQEYMVGPLADIREGLDAL